MENKLCPFRKRRYATNIQLTSIPSSQALVDEWDEEFLPCTKDCMAYTDMNNTIKFQDGPFCKLMRID